MTKFYINKETGELLNRKEMWEQFCNDYDGNDPTNIDYLNYDLYFEYVGFIDGYGDFHRIW